MVKFIHAATGVFSGRNHFTTALRIVLRGIHVQWYNRICIEAASAKGI